MIYKLKPSLLDQFRIYRDGIFEKPVDELIDSIKGIRPPTIKMTFGSLIHKYLEKEQDELEIEGKIYKLMEQEKSQLKVLMVKNSVKELKFKYMLTDEILILGVIDDVLGRMGIEYKTGSRFYGVDFYESSPQWKLYSLALNLSIFYYYHIQITGSKRPYEFKIRYFWLFPYKEMKNDMLNICYDFIDFCKRNNLEKYIIE